MLAFLIAVLAPAPAPVSETKSIKAAGFDWEYIWAKPSGKAKGLIIAMHGAGGSGTQFAVDSRWVEKSLDAGFAIALPTGQSAIPRMESNPLRNPNLWNSGELGDRGPRARIDDFAFFDALLKECQTEVGDAQLFLVGHSNGAAMTYKLAAHWPDKVKGIGMMAGDLKCDLGAKPKAAIPSLIYAGENDQLLLWKGGTVDLPWGNVKRTTEPVFTIVGKWATWMGLANQPKKSAGDGVIVYDYGKDVKLVFIEGQGHVWPGGRAGDTFGRHAGQDSGKVDATSEVLKFFEAQIKG